MAAGILFALNALGITRINIFFDGWWTLFIIVPCTVGLITERDKTGNLIGILIGVFILLCCQDIISFLLLLELLLPAIAVVVGFKLIVSGVFGNKANDLFTKLKENGKKPVTGTATFSSCDLNFDNEVFEAAELTSTFGIVKCDMRNALITHDCAIRAKTVFGGIEILVSDNVNVKISSTSIFGRVANKTSAIKNAPTVYVNATCIFGTVDIKNQPSKNNHI